MSRGELYAAIKERGCLADISSRTKLRLGGADRLRFLNGQVSNDVRKLIKSEAMYACVMTAKGKMCGDVFITATADFLQIDAEPSLRESLGARLERYLISDDVQISDVTDDFALFHICGDASAVEKLDLQSAHATRASRLGKIGVDLFLPRAQSEIVWSTLAENFPIADEEMQELMRIEAGVPRWGFELSDDTIPVEAGLEKTAVDYHKGCYVGQEIISRLKSVGHVNKHLRGFVAHGDFALAPGMKLFAPDDATRAAGWITSVAHSFALAGNIALGYLKRGIASSVLHARTADREEIAGAVDVRELPFIS